MAYDTVQTLEQGRALLSRRIGAKFAGSMTDLAVAAALNAAVEPHAKASADFVAKDSAGSQAFTNMVNSLAAQEQPYAGDAPALAHESEQAACTACPAKAYKPAHGGYPG